MRKINLKNKKMKILSFYFLFTFLTAIVLSNDSNLNYNDNHIETKVDTCKDNENSNCRENNTTQSNIKSIIFAGGCFWGVERYFSQVNGVISATSGYTGGKEEYPKYEDVKAQRTGHTEAVKVIYNSNQVNLLKLLDHFFNIVDPTTLNYQKGDSGPQYRSGIFYNDLDEKQLIDNYVNCIKGNYKDKIVTEILQASVFWQAEDYHQKYLERNPNGYCHLTKNDYERIPLIDMTESLVKNCLNNSSNE